MESIYIGLDVHQKSTTVCIQDKTGKELALTACSTDQAGFAKTLGPWLSQHPGSPVGMESCSKAYLVSGIVERLGGNPWVVPADEVSSKTRSRKKKNDTRDARDLCSNLRTGALQRRVALPPPAMRDLRDVLRTRQMQVKQRVQATNRAKALLREHGLAYASGTLVSEAQWQQRLEQELPPRVRLQLETCQNQARLAVCQVALLEQEIEELASQNPSFAVVRTIPGVGPLTAAALAAYLFEVSRFPDAKTVSAYAGLCPSSYDSGDRHRGGRITKEGPSVLRSLLVEAAQHASRPYHPLHRPYLRYRAKHGHKKATVAIANKLCRIAYAMVKNQEAFDATSAAPSGPSKKR